MDSEKPEIMAEGAAVSCFGCFPARSPSIQPRRRFQTVASACGHARTKIWAIAAWREHTLDPSTEVTDVVFGGETQAISVEKGKGASVFLHVYDTLDFATADSSMPVVHLGVEIFGNEFFFGEGGMRFTKPGTYNHKHRRRLLLGYSKMQKRQVYKVITGLKKAWPGERYRLVGCNCQTFAIELCEHLGLGSCIPGKYTCFAKTFLAPITDLIPTAVCQQLGSQSNSGSGSGPSSSSGNGCDVSDVLEMDRENCATPVSGRMCGSGSGTCSSGKGSDVSDVMNVVEEDSCNRIRGRRSARSSKRMSVAHEH